MTEPQPRPPAAPARTSRLLIEIVETLVLTLVIFVIVQTFVAQPYQVQQHSMERTLEPEQYVLVDKLTPRLDGYHRGDIVVFRPPAGVGEGDTPFIKRVIGVAGDRVVIRDGAVTVNGVTLDEPYTFADPPGSAPQPTEAGDPSSWRVPTGDVFLLGDHRAASDDSRAFGPVSLDSIVGRAWLRYWPFDTFGVLPAVTYPPITSGAPAG